MEKIVRDFAAARYRDGYEKGIHDHDAALILGAIVALYKNAGELVLSPRPRAPWLLTSGPTWRKTNARRGPTAWPPPVPWMPWAWAPLPWPPPKSSFSRPWKRLTPSVLSRLSRPVPKKRPLTWPRLHARRLKFVVSADAQALSEALEHSLKDNPRKAFDAALESLKSAPDATLGLVKQAIDALALRGDLAGHAHFATEAAGLFLHKKFLNTSVRRVELTATVKGLLGQHDRVKDNQLNLSIDDSLARYQRHVDTFLPGYRQYQTKRTQVLSDTRQSMRLEEFKAKPLTSFVRNRDQRGIPGRDR